MLIKHLSCIKTLSFILQLRETLSVHLTQSVCYKTCLVETKIYVFHNCGRREILLTLPPGMHQRLVAAPMQHSVMHRGSRAVQERVSPQTSLVALTVDLAQLTTKQQKIGWKIRFPFLPGEIIEIPNGNAF